LPCRTWSRNLESVCSRGVGDAMIEPGNDERSEVWKGGQN
jgi:hypothetical protein